MLKIAAAAMVIAAIFAILTFSPIFKVSKLNVNQQEDCLPQNVLEELEVSTKNIFSVDKNNLSQALTSKYTCAQSINVSKKLPNTIVLDVKTKKLVAAVEGTDILLTNEGDAVTAKNSKDLPKIFLPQNTSVQSGQKLTDDQILFALKVTELLTKTDFSPTSVRLLDKPDVAVYDAKGIVALFSQNDSAEQKVDSLQSVLAKAKIDSTKIAKIDLRFQKPVIEIKK